MICAVFLNIAVGFDVWWNVGLFNGDAKNKHVGISVSIYSLMVVLFNLWQCDVQINGVATIRS